MLDARAGNDGVPHDKGSRDQEWLLAAGFLRGEIEHRPSGSDWPRVTLKITDRGREALRGGHGKQAKAGASGTAAWGSSS